MKHTMLALAAASLLVGSSAAGLAQSWNPGANPNDTTASTPNQPPSATSQATQHTAGARGTGMSTDRVKQIQSALDQKGQHVAVDGHWGKQTASAIRKFQKQNGLKATGRADPQTMQKLGVSG